MTAAKNASKIRDALLFWYDHNRRILPWRSSPNKSPDPYHVWLSEIMLQQTTVPAVIPYFQRFINKWPTLEDLANSPIETIMQEWAGLGYYARARNLHKCAQIISKEYNGRFPENQKDLQKLPGIGEYTGAAIMAIAFGKSAVVIDGNVDRVIARLFCIETAMPLAKKDIRVHAEKIYEGQSDKTGDLAQAFMDLGSGICTPASPQCPVCPLNKLCAGYHKGLAEKLPLKAPKKKKPQKYGYVYWIENDVGVLTQRRGDTEMMGGMIGLPTSNWEEKITDLCHPPYIKILKVKEKAAIRHSFTHFDLELIPVVAKSVTPPATFEWRRHEELNDIGFPTLFKKAYKLFWKKS